MCRIRLGFLVLNGSLCVLLGRLEYDQFLTQILTANLSFDVQIWVKMKNLLKSGGHGGGLEWGGRIQLIKNGIETRLICEKSGGDMKSPNPQLFLLQIPIYRI